MATLIKSQTFPLIKETDVVQARQMARQWSVEIAFGLVDQTKIVTAVSELARNTITYGGGGVMTIEVWSEGLRKGLKAIFEDKGPGIANIELALQDGFTTGGGLGLGLSGAKRLSNEFEIASKPGEGTRVAITRWK
jgi:serine/threonine-protein kinase RsbT